MQDRSLSLHFTKNHVLVLSDVTPLWQTSTSLFPTTNQINWAGKDRRCMRCHEVRWCWSSQSPDAAYSLQ